MKALLVFVAICLAGGAAASTSMKSSLENWYPTIQKPAWNPSSSVFAPVWSSLYVMIGVAGWQIWRKEASRARRRLLVLWGAQLALNFLWTPLFFGLRSPGLAALEIGLLWIFIAAFTIQSRHLSRGAALLFIPYWAWVTFAAALNVELWLLNRLGPAS